MKGQQTLTIPTKQSTRTEVFAFRCTPEERAAQRVNPKPHSGSRSDGVSGWPSTSPTASSVTTDPKTDGIRPSSPKSEHVRKSIPHRRQHLVAHNRGVRIRRERWLEPNRRGIGTQPGRRRADSCPR